MTLSNTDQSHCYREWHVLRTWLRTCIRQPQTLRLKTATTEFMEVFFNSILNRRSGGISCFGIILPAKVLLALVLLAVVAAVVGVAAVGPVVGPLKLSHPRAPAARRGWGP